MLRRLTFVSLVALMHAPLTAAQPDPIDAIVSEEMQSQRIPGMAVAVIRRGEIVTAQGYGLANVEHNVPVTDRTIFQSGSLGKQFTATAVMLQVQDGRCRCRIRSRSILPTVLQRGATSPCATCSRIRRASRITTTASSITARTTPRTSW